jgi:hypothetical protein
MRPAARVEATVRIAAALLVLALAGCGAQSVRRPILVEDSPYAPLNNYAAKDGVVKYANEGIGAIVSARREAAYKEMFDACGGRYEILEETDGHEGAVATSIGASAVAVPVGMHYIRYRCASGPKP